MHQASLPSQLAPACAVSAINKNRLVHAGNPFKQMSRSLGKEPYVCWQKVPQQRLL